MPGRYRVAAGLLTLLTLTAPGCNDGGGGFFNPRMTIVSNFPGNGSADVPPNTLISVRFSSAVLGSSVSPDTFRVVGSESGPASGSFRLGDDDRVVTFTSTESFAAGELVTVTTSSRILSQSGTSARNHHFEFRISPDPAIDPATIPRLIARSPGRGESAVALDALVELTFDRELDAASIDGDSVALVSDLRGIVAADITVQSVTDGSGAEVSRLTLRPQAAFLAGETIELRLSVGLLSHEGIAFAGEAYRFSTASTPSDPARVLTRGAGLDLPGSTIVELRSADLDADGRLDLVAREESATRVHVLAGRGDGTFSASTSLELGQVALTICVVDFDGNGWLDVLAGTEDRVAIFQFMGADAGGIHYNDPVFLATGSAVHSIAVADLDHGKQGGSTVRKSDFVLDTDKGLLVYTGALSGSPAQTVGEGRRASTPLRLWDLSPFADEAPPGDGSLDLIYGDREGDRVSVHAFEGFGFGPAAHLPLSTDALEVHPADLDRDGAAELIVLTAFPEGIESIQLVSADPDAPEPGPPSVLPTLARSSLTVADLDGDGWSDLIQVNPEVARIQFQRNRAGTLELLSPWVDLASDLPVRCAVVHDFTGDGVLDIVASAGDRLVTLMSELPEPIGEAVLTVDEVSVRAGDSGARLPVSYSSSVGIDEYTVVLGFDPAVAEAREVSLTGSASAAAAPVFTASDLRNAGGLASFTAVFDEAPFDGTELPASGGDLLFELVVDIPEGAPIGSSPVSVIEEDAGSGLATSLRFDGFTLPYTSTAGALRVEVAEPSAGHATLLLGSVEAEAGARDVPVEVSLTTTAPVDAYTVLVGYDTVPLSATAVDIEATATGERVLFFDAALTEDAAGWISYNAVLSPLVPDNAIPPGDGQTLFRVLFDVSADALAGDYPLTVLESAGETRPMETVLTQGGTPLTLDRLDGAFRVLEVVVPPVNTAGVVGASAVRGSRGVAVGVSLANESPADILTLILTFDPAALRALGVDTSNTELASLDPLIQTEIDNTAGFVEVNILFKNPLAGTDSLEPGAERTLFELLFDVTPDAAIGPHALALVETTAGATLSSRLLNGGQSMPLDLGRADFVVEEKPPVVSDNKVWFTDLRVSPGLTEIWTTLNTVHPEGDIMGFTVTGTHDPSVMRIVRFDVSGTDSATLAPEFEAPVFAEGDPEFTYTALYDFEAPFLGDKVLPAGETHSLVRLVFDVLASAPAGDHQLRLANVFGDSDRPNSLIFRGQDGGQSFSVAPEVRDALVRVGPAGPRFVRGDIDLSGRIDSTDHALLLEFLTKEGIEPLCLDAADVDDSGLIDEFDLLDLLNYVFTRQPVPPPPLEGAPGEDITLDELDCKQGL